MSKQQKKGDLACSSDTLSEKAGKQVAGQTDWRNSVERQKVIKLELHEKSFLTVNLL